MVPDGARVVHEADKRYMRVEGVQGEGLGEKDMQSEGSAGKVTQCWGKDAWCNGEHKERVAGRG